MTLAQLLNLRRLLIEALGCLWWWWEIVCHQPVRIQWTSTDHWDILTYRGWFEYPNLVVSICVARASPDRTITKIHRLFSWPLPCHGWCPMIVGCIISLSRSTTIAISVFSWHLLVKSHLSLIQSIQSHILVNTCCRIESRPMVIFHSYGWLLEGKILFQCPLQYFPIHSASSFQVVVANSSASTKSGIRAQLLVGNVSMVKFGPSINGSFPKWEYTTSSKSLDYGFIETHRHGNPPP